MNFIQYELIKLIHEFQTFKWRAEYIQVNIIKIPK